MVNVCPPQWNTGCLDGAHVVAIKTYIYIIFILVNLMIIAQKHGDVIHLYKIINTVGPLILYAWIMIYHDVPANVGIGF